MGVQQKRIEIVANGKNFGTTMKGMRANVKSLRAEMLKLTEGTQAFNNKTKQLKAAQADLARMNTKLRGTTKAMHGASGGLKGFVQMFNPAMVAAFAFIAVIGNAFNKIKDFQQANADLASVLGTTRGAVVALTEDAKSLGATTVFTAIEVAGLQKAYAKLGFVEGEILNITGATLELAAATGSDLAQSAEVAGGTLRGFGLESGEMQRVVDVMAKSFSSSALDMEKFSVGMSKVGPVAKTSGESIERTTALLGVLSNNNIDASISGTSLRNIFLTLAKDGLTWQGAMDKIRSSTNKNATAFELFGKRGATAAIILADSTEEIDKLEGALKNAGGAAERMAKEQLNTLQGSLTLLGSAWSGFILGLDDGDGFISKTIRGIADFTTGMLGLVTNTKKGSDIMQEQKDEINLLVFKLGDLNISEEERLKLITKLNKVAPKLAKTLNSQGVATKKTRIELDKLNKSFIANIALEIKAEEIKEVAAVQAERQIAFFEKEAAVVSQLNIIRESGSLAQQELIDKGQALGLTNFEIADSLISVADKTSAFTAKGNAGNVIIDRSVNKLLKYSTALLTAQKSLSKAKNATDVLREQNEKLRQSFIETGDIIEEEGASTVEVTETTTMAVDAIDEAAKEKLKERKVDFDKLQSETEFENRKLRIAAIEDELEREQALIDLNRDKKLEKLDQQREDVIASTNLTGEQKAAAITLLNANEALVNQEAIQAKLEAEGAKEEELLKAQEEFIKEQAEIDKKRIAQMEEDEDFKRYLLFMTLDIYAAAFDAYASVMQDKQNAAFQNERDRTNAHYNQELGYLQNRLDIEQITQADFNDAKKELDKQLALDKYEIDKKQFYSDRKFALGQIAIQTALSIARSLASLPWPASLVPAAFALALGGVQVAAVLAEKPPDPPGYAEGGYTSIAKGGKVRGKQLAWVAEEGQEQVIPNWMVRSPKYANALMWLEGERQLGNRGFAAGGFTDAAAPSQPVGDGQDNTIDTLALGDDIKLLIAEVRKTNNLIADWPTVLQVHNNVNDTADKIKVVNKIRRDSGISRAG
jgi:minor tail protein